MGQKKPRKIRGFLHTNKNLHIVYQTLLIEVVAGVLVELVNGITTQWLFVPQ
jgi:hypothetical protein